MKRVIYFFKSTGKYYTTEDMEFSDWPGGDRTKGFETFLQKMLTTDVEGTERTRYEGMTAVCIDWQGYPILAKVPVRPVEADGRVIVATYEHAKHLFVMCGNWDVWGKLPSGELKKLVSVQEAFEFFGGKAAIEAVARNLIEADDKAGTPPEKRLDTQTSNLTAAIAYSIKKSCNMHDDCDASEAQAKAEGKNEKWLGGGRLEHCFSDDCEECNPK